MIHENPIYNKPPREGDQFVDELFDLQDWIGWYDETQTAWNKENDEKYSRFKKRYNELDKYLDSINYFELD